MRATSSRAMTGRWARGFGVLSSSLLRWRTSVLPLIAAYDRLITAAIQGHLAAAPGT